jgi:uncharacterized RmlC-like cupin family protein
MRVRETVPDIEVVREADLRPGDPTPGISRSKAFEGSGVLVARTRVAPGVVSGWHHHGSRTVYGYLVSGRLRFDYGRGGKDSLEVRPGEHFRIYPRVIHRDVNPSPTEEVVIVNVFVGDGPSLINVAGPAR